MAQIQYDTGHLDRAEQASRLALERDTSKIPEVQLLLVNIYRWRGEKAKLALELQAYLANAPEVNMPRPPVLRWKRSCTSRDPFSSLDDEQMP